tara:strand:- start:2409 stop:3119 length:711 start_codon:yes stop_codon:yes gene_type:complete
MGSTEKVVIIPTFNESENISKIVENLSVLEMDILIVDDNSPDKTFEIVENLKLKNNRISLIKRSKKLGLGSAYRDGFKHCLEMNYTHFIQMDADFSHRIEDLNKMLVFSNNYDLVIGSRYIEGGSSEGWSKRRKSLSRFANKYAKFITGCKIEDMTSGFRIYSKKALQKMKFEETTSDGYGFQIEMSARAYKKKLNFIEVPIIFNERREGESKMDLKIIIEALFIVFRLRLSRLNN